jgi:hypothetical protein
MQVKVCFDNVIIESTPIRITIPQNLLTPLVMMPNHPI